jgi:hypothetical protein
MRDLTFLGASKLMRHGLLLNGVGGRIPTVVTDSSEHSREIGKKKKKKMEKKEE